MTQSELITYLAKLNHHLYKRDVSRVVTTIFNEIAEALACGNRVELRGFGSFSIRKCKARFGRNPKTGNPINISEKAIIIFKISKFVNERLNVDL
ncbi:MAG: integration host factor subunit beta [Rhodospirillaceae bacterium]|jgi:integration host factor subunit beta|nr:integration host factor subunit beta [Rhodospirillaceae bacterium]